ncbi:hypothetical protein I532_01395 [Brevibacillus borstelensis AK1]|uniref:Uncharacterized protein n=1 Tax=Brevibacillus borstelensis AK1 TaxID=1300222 RepID=M8DD34_9BACL|nr:hypothetical protein [Brevibacillus borstelensis]EMT54219.1 hypothetical protein I532_01395 [Brevibacillus borstelensis AK1]
MNFIKFVKETETKAVVYFTHRMPFDEIYGLTEEELSKGILVEEVPDPEDNGKEPTLYINPETLEMWYEYKDLPLTPEERINQLETQLKITQDALDALLLG